MAILGIDLGTSNTLAAKLNINGEPELLEFATERLIPSVIYLEDADGNPQVGEYAMNMWADPKHDPGRSFRRWKLKMGEEQVLRRLKLAGGRAADLVVTPEYLTTVMVEHLVRTVSQGLDGEDVEGVLVTVPHGWRREKPEKCRATRLAAAGARHNGLPLPVQELTVSEPIAAAAYWLWVAERKGKAGEFHGRTIMVCDVGGGTFDVSLVRVGGTDMPLDVIDAINNDIAGDYTDALLTAMVCRKFNEQFATSYPETAEEILCIIESDEHHWLRDWFIQVKKHLKEALCCNIEMCRKRNKPADEARAVRGNFEDVIHNFRAISLSAQDLVSILEPFYQAGRYMVHQFLDRVRERDSSVLPHAVVFAGGGSRIYGIGDQVIMPVLNSIYGSESAAAEVMARIETNVGRRDEVIAMGAALIANGVVKVQERLLHDVGMVACFGASIAAALNLPPDTEKVLLSPLLHRSAPLPARITSEDIGVPCNLEPGETLDLDVMIDDDSDDPWTQHWELPHPAQGKSEELYWEMKADPDGALTVQLHPKNGQAVAVEGRLERKRSGRASIVFGLSSGTEKMEHMPRVTPAQLVAIWKQFGGGT